MNPATLGLSNTNPFSSPSLITPGQSAQAYEVKFLITEQQGQEVESWARDRFQVDAHGNPQQNGAYHITSLYTDTVGLDVYHRMPGYRRKKLRVRRYDSGTELFLERKTRKGDRVAKRRDIIPLSDLPLLEHSLSVTDWAGHEFHHRLLARQLRPVCRIRYDRTAFMGSSSEGPLRLTLDRNVHGALTSRWDLTSHLEVCQVLKDWVILELKFRNAMPALFKRLVHDMKLDPTGVSKYRRCLEAWELPVARSEQELSRPG